MKKPNASRHLIRALTALLLALPAVVEAQFSFTTNNGAITITRYNGKGGDVTVPDWTNGHPVTTIGSSLGPQVFLNCNGLRSITIGTNATTIWSPLASFCYGLTAITVHTNNPAYSSLAGAFFNKRQTTLIQYPQGKFGSYTIPDSVTSIGNAAFEDCTGLTNVTIPYGVTNIAYLAFQECTSLSSVTLPNSVTTIGWGAFQECALTNVTIPNSVTSIGDLAFNSCNGLTAITVDTNNPAYSSVAGVLFNKNQTALIQCPQGMAGSYVIPNGVTAIGDWAFDDCGGLTNVTIPDGVTSIGYEAFEECTSLTGLYFQGNAPSFGTAVFVGDDNATVYYLPETTGWGATFGGRPTAPWGPPIIQTPPPTQTAEAGSAVGLWVKARGGLPLFYLWYLDDTNLLGCSTNCALALTNVQVSQSGMYTVIITNASGAVTSASALVNVIAAVERRAVPGVKVTGEPGSLLNVDCANSLSPAPNWTTLGSVSLTGTSQYVFDLMLPLPPQRFYRAWQPGAPGVIPALDLHLVPAITLTGNLGDTWRVDYINRFGPTDAWVTLDTVTLTNTAQLYFDVSAPGQPERLYRLVKVP